MFCIIAGPCCLFSSLFCFISYSMCWNSFNWSFFQSCDPQASKVCQLRNFGRWQGVIYSYILYSFVCMWHFKIYSEVYPVKSRWEWHFQVVKLAIEENLTYLLADGGELFLFLDSAVISPWLSLWRRERWLFTCYYLLWATGRSRSEKLIGCTPLSVGRRSDREHRVNSAQHWKGEAQLAHPVNQHGQVGKKWWRCEGLVDLCLF